MLWQPDYGSADRCYAVLSYVIAQPPCKHWISMCWPKGAFPCLPPQASCPRGNCPAQSLMVSQKVSGMA